MPKKMAKKPLPPPTPPECNETLGISPAVLAKRDINKKSFWCPSPPKIEYDPYSDPYHPKTIHYSDVMKADEIIKDIIHTTPLLALAYQGQLLEVPVTVVLPASTAISIVTHCQNFGATVVLFGNTITEAMRHAFEIIIDNDGVGTYLNGYDHPHVIAGAGSIGVEILEQLPDTEAILIPVGGGGLLAGISTVVKHMKPGVLIYGIEPGKSCSFAKALDNERPYNIEAEKSLAASLAIPRAGENAFHTARSLVDKMVLIHDDWTARAILHLLEEENIVAEGAGAISLGALMCLPAIFPELRGKKVVSIVSGGNIDIWPLKRAILNGKAVDGRMISITIRMMPGGDFIRNKIFKVIQHMGCNVTYYETEREWLSENKLLDNYLTILCETKDFRQSCTLRSVIQKLFPNTCEFTGDTFKYTCTCFTKKLH